MTDIKKDESVASLRKFVERIRSGEGYGKKSELGWIDWELPIHWGGMSDPFQPLEEKFGYSYECLQYLAESQYPVIISTKGTRLLSSDKYLDVLSKCNAVVQVSMQCSEFDQFEPGAPTFEERLEDLAKISPKVKRTIIRLQPYIPRFKKSIIDNLPRFKEAGAYGVILEGLKMDDKSFDPQLVKVGSEFLYPYPRILEDFLKIKHTANELGMKAFAGENRIREYGDSLTCCGVDDIFTVNRYNLNHLLHNDKAEPTKRMMEYGGDCFRASGQSTAWGRITSNNGFAPMMRYFYENKKNLVKSTFALGEEYRK